MDEAFRHNIKYIYVIITCKKTDIIHIQHEHDSVTTRESLIHCRSWRRKILRKQVRKQTQAISKLCSSVYIQINCFKILLIQRDVCLKFNFITSTLTTPTSWSWVIIEKLMVAQLVTNFLTIYCEPESSLPCSKRLPLVLILIQINPVAPCHPISLRSIKMLASQIVLLFRFSD
jgi:hypothetical protein